MNVSLRQQLARRCRVFSMVLVTAATVLVGASPALAQDDVRSFELEADLRLRHESNTEVPGGEDFHRLRMRARVGGVFTAASWLDFGVRARTGNPDDPNSPYVDFTSNFDSFTMALDRAYARAYFSWGGQVYGGKFAHVAKLPEMVWDADVQPTGLAATYRRKMDGKLARVGASTFFYVIDNPNGGPTAKAAGGDLSALVRAGNFDVALSGAVHVFDDIDSLAAESGGNAVDGAGLFVNDFQLLSGGLKLSSVLANRPVAVDAFLIANAGADDDNIGFRAGVTIGRLDFERSWRLRYHYSDVQQESVLAALAQDDFRLATDYRGHDIQAAYKLADRVTVTGKIYLFQFRPGDDPATMGVDEGKLQFRGRIDLDVTY